MTSVCLDHAGEEKARRDWEGEMMKIGSIIFYLLNLSSLSLINVSDSYEGIARIRY
jgi:hypothetical protein